MDEDCEYIFVMVGLCWMTGGVVKLEMEDVWMVKHGKMLQKKDDLKKKNSKSRNLQKKILNPQIEKEECYRKHLI